MSYILKMDIYSAYISKRSWNYEREIILLMIPNGERLHYHAVKKLSALLRGITSKNNGDFDCLNCLHSFRTKNKLASHIEVCEKKTIFAVL